MEGVTDPIPQYEPYVPAGGNVGGTMRCPKCGGSMRTYERNGVQLEQCGNCRGVFLDFGELEHLTQMEARAYQQQAPQQYQPGPMGYGPDWGSHGGRHYRKRGFGGLFFSS